MMSEQSNLDQLFAYMQPLHDRTEEGLKLLKESVEKIYGEAIAYKKLAAERKNKIDELEKDIVQLKKDKAEAEKRFNAALMSITQKLEHTDGNIVKMGSENEKKLEELIDFLGNVADNSNKNYNALNKAVGDKEIRKKLSSLESNIIKAVKEINEDKKERQKIANLVAETVIKKLGEQSNTKREKELAELEKFSNSNPSCNEKQMKLDVVLPSQLSGGNNEQLSLNVTNDEKRLLKITDNNNDTDVTGEEIVPKDSESKESSYVSKSTEKDGKCPFVSVDE